jgi:phosphatidylinositol alpha-1,6-mannosyltransferase
MGCAASDKIISVSDYTAGFLYLYGISRERVAVIHNGANKEVFRVTGQGKDSLKKQYGYGGMKVILTVGSVSERKGQDIVIKAMAKVIKEVPDAIYIVAGRSTDFSHFKKIGEACNVSSHISFLGAVPNQQLVDLYNLADVFILASRHSKDGDFEGFGIAVIEAALCGLPSIVSTDSGLTEAIEEGVTGLSISPESSDEAADAILVLLKDNALRNKLSENGLMRAKNSFTWDKVGERYNAELIKLFEENETINRIPHTPH